MAFDQHKNLAIASVTNAPGAAGTTLTVAGGEGARFPAVPFNATVWPATELPTPVTAEVVRVTAIAADSFTITRSQEGTTARAIVAGDLIAATITAKTITDIESGVNFPLITTPGHVSTGGLFLFGGTTNAFPSLQRSGDAVQVMAGDVSDFRDLVARQLITAYGVLKLSSAGPQIRLGTGSKDIQLTDVSNTDFNLLQFGGTTSAYPALKRSGAGLAVRTADDSAAADLSAGNLTEKGRTTPMGHWIDGSAFLTGGWTGSYRYALVGKAMVLAIYVTHPTLAAVGQVNLTLPYGWAAPAGVVMVGVNQGGAWVFGQGFNNGSDAILTVFAGAGGFTGGSTIISCFTTLPIL